MLGKLTFDEWLEKYKEERGLQLKKWQEKTGHKSLLPKGFDKKFLKQYTIYQTEIGSRQLVIATWVLAIATIILSVLTLFWN